MVRRCIGIADACPAIPHADGGSAAHIQIARAAIKRHAQAAAIDFNLGIIEHLKLSHGTGPADGQKAAVDADRGIIAHDHRAGSALIADIQLIVVLNVSGGPAHVELARGSAPLPELDISAVIPLVEITAGDI